MVSCDFDRVIELSDKIDERPVRNTQEIMRFLGTVHRYLDINQVCHGYQWADICARVLASHRSSKLSTDKTLYNPLSLPAIQKSWRSLR